MNTTGSPARDPAASCGADRPQPTDRVSRFLESAGVIAKKTRANPKTGTPGKNAVERAQSKADKAAKAAAAAAAPAPVEEAPAEAPAEAAAETTAETSAEPDAKASAE